MSTLMMPRVRQFETELWDHRGWLIGVGAALLALGAAAVGLALATSLATMVFLGSLMVMAGVIQGVHAFHFWGKAWGSFVPWLLAGILYVVAGVLVLSNPVGAVVGATLLLALVMIVNGLLRLVWAAATPIAGRGMMLLDGVLTLLLGVLIWARWPSSAAWAIGAFVGVDVMVLGGQLLALGMSATRPSAAPG